MKVMVVNKELNVGAVKVISISGSSVFLVGDTQTINCSSAYNSLTEYIKDDQVIPNETQSKLTCPKENS